ncbi:TetR/AcrR family transcriptional regulator [Patulibacter defluvii]|uniref:TetR/AcrR family transcriptional regulator n=1 Tax=Patulibacter defluvii TaxID=3095358 RepID=UPI002A761341|nr:TetR/AcrR family transcriptional regulator [Patulibacter sp. DM4]
MATTVTERHVELLDEAVELFLAEGFAGFTLSDLAARLRCSKTTLYALGRTKEQLTAGVVRHFFRRATAFVEQRTAAHDDPAERIVAYLRAVADALRPASPRFMADLAEHAAAAEVYEQNTAAAAARVRRLIAEGVDGGEFRAVHAAFVADTVAATMTRIQDGTVLRTTGLHDADAYEELAALVLGGVRR